MVFLTFKEFSWGHKCKLRKLNRILEEVLKRHTELMA